MKDMKERIGTVTVVSEGKTLGNSKGHPLAPILSTHSEGLKTKAVLFPFLFSPCSLSIGNVAKAPRYYGITIDMYLFLVLIIHSRRIHGLSIT